MSVFFTSLATCRIQIGPSSFGTNYLQMFQGISPVNQVILGKGLGK
jgi:hypothetical protein